MPKYDQISSSKVSTSVHSDVGASSQSSSRPVKLLEIKPADYQPDLAEKESSNIDFNFISRQLAFKIKEKNQTKTKTGQT